MNKYTAKLEALTNESNAYFEMAFESEEAEEKENIRIKSSLLNLIQEAKDNESEVIYQKVKKSVIEYLCEICGHSGDLDILKSHSPSILSDEELEYIIQNSALSRWF